MTALLLLFTMIAPWAHDDRPGKLVRFRSVPVSESPAPERGWSGEFVVPGTPVLRFDARPGKCVPSLFTVEGEGAATTARPVSLRQEGTLAWAAIPAFLNPSLDEEATLRFRVTRPAGCGRDPVRVYVAEEKDDEYGLARVAGELRALAERGADPQQANAIIRGAHPLRWQEEVALALALSNRLAPLPGAPEALKALRHALMEEAVQEARAADTTFFVPAPLEMRTPEAAVGDGSPTPWHRLASGETQTWSVEGEEGVRLFLRGVTASDEPQLFAVDVSFDSGEATRWPLVVRADPDHPGFSRFRGVTLTVPAGARACTLRVLEGAMAVRGFALHHKPHLEEAPGVDSATGWWRRVAQFASDTPRDRLLRAVSDEQLRLNGGRLGVDSAEDVLLQAWRISRASRRWDTGGLRELRETEAQVRSAGASDGALTALLLAALAREEVRILTVHDRLDEAEERAITLATDGTMTHEDALTLAAIDSASGDSLATSPRALALLDTLVAERPMDRELIAARHRVFHDATGWMALTAEGEPEPLSTLETLDSAAQGERSAFVPLDGKGFEIDLPTPALPGHRPTFSLVTERPAGLARVVDVEVDGATVHIPAVLEHAQFDLPLAPGKHHVRLASTDFAGRVLVSHARGDGAVSLRRYALNPAATEVTFHAAEFDAPSYVRTTIRVAGATRQPLPEQLTVRIEAGNQRTELSAGLVPAGGGEQVEGASFATLSAPLEFVSPMPAGASSLKVSAELPPGLRLAVRAAVRRRRPAIRSRDAHSLSLTSVLSTTPDEMLALLRSLSARVASGEGAPEARLQRAAVLAELDEVPLAREDLLAALEDQHLGPHTRAWALKMWRAIDEIGGGHPASVTEDTRFLSPELAVVRADSVGPAVLRLLETPEALSSQTPDTLVGKAMATSEADLLLVLAARRAPPERAAPFWDLLATRHQESPLFQREAGRSWLAATTPDAPERAFLRLTEAVRLGPGDASAWRLLRRARSATESKPLDFAESSAGRVRAIQQGPAADTTPGVEESMLPPGAPEDAMLGSAGWESQVELEAATTVTLSVQPVELRSRQAKAVHAPAPQLELAHDEVTEHVPCSPQCETTLTLEPGPHRLSARWIGGVRPAGLLSLKGATSRFAMPHPVDFLVARPEMPVVLRPRGPAILTIEVRTRLDRRGAEACEVNGTAVKLDQTLSDARVRLEGGTAVSSAVVIPILLGTEDRDIVIRPKRGEILVRASLRQSRDQQVPPPSPSVPLSFGTPFQTALARPPVLVPDEVAPGWDDLGEIALSTDVRRRRLNALGVDVQPTTQSVTGLTYRRLIETIHLAVAASGELRLGLAPTGAVGGQLFYLNPQFRQLRVQLSFEGLAQPFGTSTAFSGKAQLMLEPVLQIRPGLSFVGKLAAWGSARSLVEVADTELPKLDPDVYSRYDLNHPRGLFLETGLQWTPFANMVVYGNGRLTTNPSLSPFDQDHVSASILARAVFGRLFGQIQFRGAWFFVDQARADPAFEPILSFSVMHTLWFGVRHRVELAGWLNVPLYKSDPSFIIALSWAFSNGRRFEDHTPLEGEDYFFPQRGPDLEEGRVGVPLDR